MDTPEKVLTAIYRAVDLINAELPPDRQLGKTPDTRLLGSQSVLDSLHLVSLLINIEREVEDTLGVALTLANERAFSMKESPFRTIESLASYIGVLISEAQNG
jgi:acyl carrier protein